MPSALVGVGPPGPGHRHRRLLCLVAALVVGISTACTPSSPSPQGAATAPSTTGTRTPATSNGTPTSRSGPAGDFGSDHFVPFRTTAPNSAQGKRIGVIGMDQTNPFSKLVTESIKQQAQIAGAEVVYCDAENSAEVALRCARRLATQQVDAWVTFQPISSAGQSICAAGPKDVPMISIDGAQGDCQSAQVGTDDYYAGQLVGAEVGRYVRQHFDCRVDAVILLSDPARGFADRRRVTAARTALNAFCPAITAHDESTESSTADTTGSSPMSSNPGTVDTTDTAQNTDQGTGAPDGTAGTETAGSTPGRHQPVVLELTAPDQQAAFSTVGKALTSIPSGQQVVVIGTNDGLTLGAVGAARAAGRLDSMHFAGIGADPRSYCEIASDPQWIGDAASFPERYGEIVVPYLVDLMDHRSVPQELFVRNEFVDASTITRQYSVVGCVP